MKFLVKFWHDFKLQPDVWFFYGFLLTFTLSVRKVLFFYPINGQFNEWTGIYLYSSDIFLLLALFLWGIAILRNKNVNLSTPLETCTGHKIQPHKLSMFLPNRSKPHGIFLTGSIANIILWLKQAIIYLPLLLVFWSFISILWSENQNIALFKAIKLSELFLLYIYVMYRIVPRLPREMFHVEHFLRGGILSKNTFWIIITLGFIQAVIGIWQFIIQHSIGLFWLRESLISPNIPGVAKIVLNGEKFIRVYGLFPHPNILGGFLLVSIILTIFYKRLFQPVSSNFVPRGTKLECGTSAEQSQSCNSKLDSESNVSGFRIPACRTGRKSGMTILLVIQIICLILTFSKSAIIGLFIAFLYIFWKNKKMFRACPVNCSIWNNFYGVEHLGKKAIIIAIILILSLYLVGLNFGENLEKSYGDRIDQLVIWKSITQNNLLLGTGTGNYLFHMKHLYPNLETWQYQPIHNVLLLIFSELGSVGIFIFVWFLWKLFHLTLPFSLVRIKNEGEVFKSTLFAFIFIMLFDHYLWDIQQGQIMLWLVMGILAGHMFKRKAELP